MNRIIYFDGKVVTWKHIIHFFEADNPNKSIKCAYKLKKEHIYPDPMQRQNVKLSAQVLSQMVASGMLALFNSGEIDRTRISTFLNTAEHVGFFNKLFDIFNSGKGVNHFNGSQDEINRL